MLGLYSKNKNNISSVKSLLILQDLILGTQIAIFPKSIYPLQNLKYPLDNFRAVVKLILFTLREMD